VQALPGLPEVERLHKRNRRAREEHPVQCGRLENRSVRGRSEGEGSEDDRGLRLRDDNMGGQQRRDSGEPRAAEEAGETDFHVRVLNKGRQREVRRTRPHENLRRLLQHEGVLQKEETTPQNLVAWGIT